MLQNNFNERIEEHKNDSVSARIPTCVDTAGVYICKCVARLWTVVGTKGALNI
jgi:hypothetical protein